MRKRKILSLITVLLSLLMLCTACNRNVPIVPDNSGGLQTPDPKPMGRAVSDNLIDITEPISGAIGDVFSIMDIAFVDSNVLLIAIEEQEGSSLMLYDVIKGEVTAEYDMSFSLSALRAVANGGVINVGESTISVADLFNSKVIILDKKLNEKAVYNLTDMNISPESFGDVCVTYNEDNNALICCSSFVDEDSNIYKYLLDSGEKTVLFAPAEEEASVSFRATEDSRYIYADVWYPSKTESEEFGSINENYQCIIETNTGEISPKTWLQQGISSSEGKIAISKSCNVTSAVRIEDKNVQLEYLVEYDKFIADFNSNCIITCPAIMEYDEQDQMMGQSVMLSRYDIDDGQLKERCMIKCNASTMLQENTISKKPISLDTVNGYACINLIETIEPTEEDMPVTSQMNTYLWDYGSSSIDEVSETYRLKKQDKSENKGVIDDTALSSLASKIESEFKVKVIYDKEQVSACDSEYDLTRESFTPFDENSDKEFVYESINALYNALCEYPAGFIDEMSDARGIIVFCICRNLVYTTFDFDIAGLYSSNDGYQLIYIEVDNLMPERLYSTTGSNQDFRSIAHHEISHAIQQHIFANQENAPAYDTDTYLSYYPKDFMFNTTENRESNCQKYVYCEPEDAYFPDDYSMTNILEDMARLFEFSTWSEIPENMSYPHINARYEYLCSLIRSSFNSSGWKDVEFWERSLNRA